MAKRELVLLPERSVSAVVRTLATEVIEATEVIAARSLSNYDRHPHHVNGIPWETILAWSRMSRFEFFLERIRNWWRPRHFF